LILNFNKLKNKEIITCCYSTVKDLLTGYIIYYIASSFEDKKKAPIKLIAFNLLS